MNERIEQQLRLEDWVDLCAADPKPLPAAEMRRFLELESLRKNRPGIYKTECFVASFPHALENVEFVVRWPLPNRDGKTYNPDFKCNAMKCFIEVATSWDNMRHCRDKWKMAIRRGYPLRVFWWEGQEITNALWTFRPEEARGPMHP